MRLSYETIYMSLFIQGRCDLDLGGDDDWQVERQRRRSPRP